MSYTAQLLQQNPKTLLTSLAAEFETNFKVADLLKQIAKEAFNGTMPVIFLENEADFKRAVKLAIAAKYVSAKEVETIDDLFKLATESYCNKIHDKLIRAANSIGTHVHKMTSTCIEDSANYFARPVALQSGITSATVESGRLVTGSKDGTLVAAFGLLSATYQIGEGPALSLFDRIATEDPATLELLHDLSQDKDFVQALTDTAWQHKEMVPPNKISQFHKQNFVNFGGKRITVTPLQSVNTTVALKRAIDATFQAKGRVTIKRYAAGGAQTQNVSSLNQDLGGAIPHLKAWIPSQRRQHNVFYYLYRTQRLFLTKAQKELVATLAWSINRIEVKGHSNKTGRKAIENLFTKLASLLLIELEAFVLEVNKLTDEEKRAEVRQKMNRTIKAYFTADTVQSKTEASEALALELVALIAAEMKRNKLNIHIEDSALDTATQVLQEGVVLCHTL